MYENYANKYEYIWCIKDKRKIPSKFQIVCVKNLSLSHIFYLMTSKVIISNQPIEPFLPKRNSQVFINTTHGSGAYKKGGIQATNLTTSLRFSMERMKFIRSRMIDYVISACQVYTDIFTTEVEFNIDKTRFLPYGMPRNDIFFKNNTDIIRDRICKEFRIDGKCVLIIYAPTYRGHYNSVEDVDLKMDVKMLIDSVEKRFKRKAVLLFRHHVSAAKMCVSGENVIDVSAYQDMQELLVASDIFITDYSSCMWDYSFTYRPGFLYVPDLNKYEKETQFHSPIEQWPFPYSETMDELCEDILEYDEVVSRQKIERHHAMLGCFEDGRASERISEVIVKSLN